MSHRILFPSLITALICCYSCAQREEPAAAVANAGDITISATFDCPQDQTRTTLDSDGKVFWEEGDAFALLSEQGKGRFELLSGAGEATASFTGNITGAAPYYALYPYSDECRMEGGELHFILPQEQKYVDGTFASGASPAIAYLASDKDAAQFRNLCGVLQLNFCGSSSMKMKGIEVINLDGLPLWGECSVALDGKQGTDAQTMAVTGGSNIIKVVFDKEVTLKATTPKVIDIVVPEGSFAKGLAVKIFNGKGEVISFLSTQNPQAMVARSRITTMNKLKISQNGEPADVKRRGYYKDVFMDGGHDLTSRTSLPAATYLGWSMDYLATGDSAFQNTIIIKSENDANGALVYPDGEPRYAMMYVNGGGANGHGISLTSTGRNRIVSYNNKGGCYVGSCAGAFLAHPETSKYKWLGLIPAYQTECGLMDSTTGIFIVDNSPLLNYGYDFGGDMYLSDVYFNGGGFLKPENVPAHGEILATYDFPGWVMHGCGAVWAYKANDTKGRVVCTGSHPEGITSGEQRDLMAAMMRYAVDGAGLPAAKAALANGTPKTYNKSTGTSAGIGDKQYHHFTIDVPEGVKQMKVSIKSDSDITLHLALRKGDFAWRTDADYLLVQSGSSKTLEIDSPESGQWYVSVYCAADIKTTCGSSVFKQSGDTDALNGIPYTIEASWE